MNIELRLTTLERLHEVLPLPATTITLGHEACPHKLPTRGQLVEAAALVRGSGRRFGLVLPIAYESFHEGLLSLAKELMRTGPLDVVVNDIGTLLELGAEPCETLCLGVGHGLSFSYRYQPWIDLQLGPDRPEVRSAMLGNSLDDKQLWPLLKQCAVKFIQVSALEGESDSLSSLKQGGFRLTSLLDVVPVAYSRACHTARYHEVKIPECRAKCDQPLKLGMTQRWKLFDNVSEPLSTDARAQVPQLNVFGNVVFRNIQPDLPQQVDTWALDTRFYSRDQLDRRVRELASAQV